MKEILLRSSLPILVFFVLLFLYTKFLGPIPFYINQVSTNKSDLFTVTGTGKVEVKADQANVRAGVQTEGVSAIEAQEKLNQASNKIVEAIKALGVKENDIKTDNYNINPKYDYSGGSQRQQGYLANTNITIIARDVNQVNAIIDAATSNGANVVGGADFSVQDRAEAEDEARKKAVEDAKKKALQSAKIAGFNLGKIISYSESVGGEVPRLFMDKAMPQGGAPEEPTQIQPGLNEVLVNVTLGYEIR